MGFIARCLFLSPQSESTVHSPQSSFCWPFGERNLGNGDWNLILFRCCFSVTPRERESPVEHTESFLEGLCVNTFLAVYLSNWDNEPVRDWRYRTYRGSNGEWHKVKDPLQDRKEVTEENGVFLTSQDLRSRWRRYFRRRVIILYPLAIWAVKSNEILDWDYAAPMLNLLLLWEESGSFVQSCDF